MLEEMSEKGFKGEIGFTLKTVSHDVKPSR